MSIVRKAAPVLTGALGIAAFVGLWAWLSTQTVPTRLPAPVAVWNVLTQTLTDSPVIAAQGGGDGGFLPHVWATLWHTLAAVTIGAVLGCLLGWVFATAAPARWFLQAPIEILRLVPSLIAVPFLVLWFGIGPVPQFVLIIGYTALVMQVATFTVVRDFPPHVLNYARTLGAGRWSAAATVLLPGALPNLLGSLRVTLQLAWGLAVVAELMGAQVGIGRVMSSAAVLFRTDYVVAGVIWIAAIAAATDGLFRWAIHTITAWSRDEPTTRERQAA